MDILLYARFAMSGIANLRKVSFGKLFCVCIIIIYAPHIYCQETCPVGWIGRRDRCYKLYNERLSWQLATAQCAFDGSFLTSIVSRQENEFLVESFSYEASLAWIGMNSRGRWLDGLAFQLFHNDFKYETRTSLQCTFIDLERNGLWNVSNCKESELNFICKMTLGEEEREEEEDDDGWWTWSDDDDYGNITDLTRPEVQRKLLIWLLIFAILFVLTICCSVKRCLVAKRLCSCLGKGCECMCEGCNSIIEAFIFLCECVCRMCSCIYECLCIVGLAIQLCFFTCIGCGCLNRGERDRRDHASESDPATQEPLTSHITVGSVSAITSARTETHDDPSPTDPSAPPEQPPAYDDTTTSNPPPPSYVEALEPQFDDITDSTAAPSYDSVV